MRISPLNVPAFAEILSEFQPTPTRLGGALRIQEFERYAAVYDVHRSPVRGTSPDDR